jgi:hypothetical protein
VLRPLTFQGFHCWAFESVTGGRQGVSALSFNVSVTLVKVVVMTNASRARVDSYARHKGCCTVKLNTFIRKLPQAFLCAKHCRCILLCSSTNGDCMQGTKELLMIDLTHLNEDVLAAAAS